MVFADSSRIAILWKRAGNHRRILAILIAVSFIYLCNVAFAAEKLPKYQVVPGGDDKAYLYGHIDRLCLDPDTSYTG